MYVTSAKGTDRGLGQVTEGQVRCAGDHCLSRTPLLCRVPTVSWEVSPQLAATDCVPPPARPPGSA